MRVFSWLLITGTEIDDRRIKQIDVRNRGLKVATERRCFLVKRKRLVLIIGRNDDGLAGG
jgi:hypothetical protein